MDSNQRQAAEMLRDLEGCERIRFASLGDDRDICENDHIPVHPTRDGWRHDAKVIARLRENALEGAWPR